MNRDDITLMADASGLSFYGMGKDRDKFLHYLEAFAALVAKVYEHTLALQQRSYEREIEIEVEAEREECAKVCESFIPKYERFDDQRVAGNKSRAIAAAIRARGQA
jgi:hypothetical protein